MSKLHDRLIVIDGLNVSNFSRGVFEDMRRGGVTAANCTSCVWENFTETMRNFARWKTWLRENADLITQVTTTDDIRRAKTENKTGIILGWQNSSGIEDRLDYLALFHELGLRIVQLTYNTQNLVGSGCYEQRDSGLSDFGRDVLAEMNRLGILCDLSHVGAKTSEDAILASKQRVAYSHCLPAGLKAHPRNKSDAQLRFIADRNGFIGVTMFPGVPEAGHVGNGRRLRRSHRVRHQPVRRGLRRRRHRLHARLRRGILPLDHPRQGVGPQARRLRPDHQPGGHAHHRRLPQSHGGDGEARLAREPHRQGDGRQLAAAAEGCVGTVITA